MDSVDVGALLVQPGVEGDGGPVAVGHVVEAGEAGEHGLAGDADEQGAGGEAGGEAEFGLPLISRHTDDTGALETRTGILNEAS